MSGCYLLVLSGISICVTILVSGRKNCDTYVFIQLAYLLLLTAYVDLRYPRMYSVFIFILVTVCVLYIKDLLAFLIYLLLPASYLLSTVLVIPDSSIYVIEKVMALPLCALLIASSISLANRKKNK